MHSAAYGSSSRRNSLSLVLIFTYVFVFSPQVAQQTGLVGTLLALASWAGFVVGLVTFFFSTMTVDCEGITLMTPWSRLLGFRFFPLHFGFDEIQVEFKWNGRLLTFARTDVMGWKKQAVWSVLVMGGFWVLPAKWRETWGVIEKLRSPTCQSFVD